MTAATDSGGGPLAPWWELATAVAIDDTPGGAYRVVAIVPGGHPATSRVGWFESAWDAMRFAQGCANLAGGRLGPISRNGHGVGGGGGGWSARILRGL